MIKFNLVGSITMLFAVFFSESGFGQTYCNPTTTYDPYALGINAYNHIHIGSVAFTGDNTPPVNTSWYVYGGYQDFTSLSPKCQQYPGKVIAVTVSPSTDSRIKAWADWNKDGDFTDAGEEIYNSGVAITALATTSFNVNIPPDVDPGDYRIRIKNGSYYTYFPYANAGYTYPDFTACADYTYNYVFNVSWYFFYGQAEDYNITVLDCTKTWTGAVNGNWTTAGNWSPVGMPTSDHCVEASSGTINVNSNGNAKSISLTGDSELIIPSNNTLTVENEINIASGASFIVENSGNLLQNTETANTGNSIVRRNANPMKRYDFTYWSSPVAGQTLFNLSPTTLADKYYSYAPVTGWVTEYNGAATMGIGRGYAVRAPQSFPINSTANFTGTFSGILNNGEKIVPVFEGSSTAQMWNLIGNPYPSAIDIDLFLADPENTELGGTIYLWVHNTPPIWNGLGQYIYASHDYASYNLSGGVAIAATNDPNDPTEVDDNDNTPVNGQIASGQAFFVRGITDGAGTVKFKNAMRIAGDNANFFKPGTTTPVENWQMTGKHRFWVNLKNDEGAFNQTLIGYIENATNELDRLYDGELFGGNYVSIYSLHGQTKLTIQGKALPFNEEDVIPLGYKVTIAGTFNISLDHFDGLFEGQDVFLKDNLLNVIHDLKESAYSFASAIGTFDNRFEIVYINEFLGTENPAINPESVIVYKNTNSDIVVNAGLLTLDEVKVYDVAGRLLSHSKNINTTETFIKNLPVTQQVLIVDVLTEEGYTITEKIIF